MIVKSGRGSGAENVSKSLFGPRGGTGVGGGTVTMDDPDHEILAVLSDDPIAKAAEVGEAADYFSAGLGSTFAVQDIAKRAAKEREEETRLAKTRSSRTQLGHLEFHEKATAWAEGLLGVEVDQAVALEVTKAIGRVSRKFEETAIHDWVGRYRQAAKAAAALTARDGFGKGKLIDDAPEREWATYKASHDALKDFERNPTDAAGRAVQRVRDLLPAAPAPSALVVTATVPVAPVVAATAPVAGPTAVSTALTMPAPQKRSEPDVRISGADIAAALARKGCVIKSADVGVVERVASRLQSVPAAFRQAHADFGAAIAAGFLGFTTRTQKAAGSLFSREPREVRVEKSAGGPGGSKSHRVSAVPSAASDFLIVR
jgi:hypothetical protein